MRESNNKASNVTIKQIQSEVLINNVTIEHIQEEVLLNTKGEYMKEELITQRESCSTLTSNS